MRDFGEDDGHRLGKIPQVCCLSVNDAFVMEAWRKFNDPERGPVPEEKIHFLGDHKSEFTIGVGMNTDKPDLGAQQRSARYSMYVVNETIEKVFVDEPGKYEVSSPQVMADWLNRK